MKLNNKDTRFHCCATCINFSITKTPNGVIRKCDRLQFETKPSYQFDCWDPKENVKRLLIGKNET
jgi:hypothetical protein